MGNIAIYEQYRDELKNGDLLLWKSKGVLGWLIRKFSRGNVNHAGLVLVLNEFDGLKDRRWTLEALGNGITLNLLSRRLEEFSGNVWVYPLKDEFNALRTHIGAWAIEKVGIPYDYGSLFKNALGRVSAEANKLFCSEYAYLAYLESGLPVLEQKAPRPADMPKLEIFKNPIKIL